MKIFEGGAIPEGTIVGFQVMWMSEHPKWETVTETEYYRALHQEAALVRGRFLTVQPGPTYTNGDGVIRVLKDGESD